MSAFVQRLPNSIGYVEYAYAKQNKMTYTLLKNKDGNFVPPDSDNFKSAAAGADWAKSFFQVLTDQPGKDAWPISGATFILMYKAQDKPASAANSLKFFEWAFKNGGKAAEELDYVPLPDSLVKLIAEVIEVEGPETPERERLPPFRIRWHSSSRCALHRGTQRGPRSIELCGLLAGKGFRCRSLEGMREPCRPVEGGTARPGPQRRCTGRNGLVARARGP